MSQWENQRVTEPILASYAPEQLPGHTLCDVNDKEIGTIMGVGAAEVDVATGPLHLGTHMYVPFDAIAYCTDTRCYLKIPMDQVDRQPWHQLPVERPSAGHEPAGNQPTGVRIPFRSEGPKPRQAGR
jgi:hypothetical protein